MSVAEGLLTTVDAAWLIVDVIIVSNMAWRGVEAMLKQLLTEAQLTLWSWVAWLGVEAIIE